jgi:hypothetical protein
MPCPKNVNIPLSFSFYNNKHLFKKKLESKLLYLVQNGGLQGRKPALASQCVDCGACVARCPQKIDIPFELKKVKGEFEGVFTKPLLVLMGMVMSMSRRRH